MPPVLQPFLELARRYRRQYSGEKRSSLAHHLADNPGVMEELYRCAIVLVGPDTDEIFDWIATDHPDSRKFEGLGAQIDEMQLYPPQPPKDRVQVAIKRLRRFGTFGKSMGRFHAAYDLAYCGPRGLQAQPELVLATEDESTLTRMAAHFALAMLTGDHAPHRRAIQELTDSLDPNDRLYRLCVHTGPQSIRDLEMTTEQYVKESFRRSLIDNDLEDIKRLIGSIDINESLENGSFPIHMITKDWPPSVQFLLEQGADPNVPSESVNLPIHDAAQTRFAERVIELLVQYGADPAARNAAGDTPIQLAKCRKLKGNIEALKRLIEKRP